MWTFLLWHLCVRENQSQTEVKVVKANFVQELLPSGQRDLGIVRDSITNTIRKGGICSQAQGWGGSVGRKVLSGNIRCKAGVGSG